MSAKTKTEEHRKSSIGVFDSGVGGLFILHAMVKKLPQYDYLYLGDTARAPYGERSSAELTRYLTEAVAFLFSKNCPLVIVACNTASAAALRHVQRTYLARHFPKNRVLGVIVPTLEEMLRAHHGKTVGVLATPATVATHAYRKELKKVAPSISVIECKAPGLAPAIEQGDAKRITIELTRHLSFLKKKNITALVLGCTHYGIVKKQIHAMLGGKIPVLSQESIIPVKLRDYLRRHGELEKRLAHTRRQTLFLTKKNRHFDILARKWFGAKTTPRRITIPLL